MRNLTSQNQSQHSAAEELIVLLPSLCHPTARLQVSIPIVFVRCLQDHGSSWRRTCEDNASLLL